jgi:phosphohistidine phosphatase
LEIYLVRHGLAEERGGAKPDAERALTKKGRRRTKKAMRGFAKTGARPKLILSSPLVRAWETAEILAKVLDASEPRVEEDLAPGGEPARVLERLRAEDRESVALVGHEPDLSELAALLGGGRVELDKAAIARLDGDPEPGHARAVWLLQPLLLKRLAR